MEFRIKEIRMDNSRNAGMGLGGPVGMGDHTVISLEAEAYISQEMKLRAREGVMDDILKGYQPGALIMPSEHAHAANGMFDALMKLTHEVQSLAAVFYAGHPARLDYVWDRIKYEKNNKEQGQVHILDQMDVTRLMTAILAQLDEIQTSIDKNGIPE